MVRGVKIGSTNVPITDVSLNVNKSPLIEQSLYSTIASAVHVGGESVTGTINANYRDALKTYVTGLASVINTGTGTFSTTYVITVAGDDASDSTQVASCIFNSVKISANIKDYVKVSLGFIGKHATSDGSAASDPNASATIGIFYNTTVGVGGSTFKTNTFDMSMDVPIDQDYFVLGNPWLYDYYQSDLAKISCTLTCSNAEYAQFASLCGTTAYTQDIKTTHNVVIGEGSNLVFKIGEPSGTTMLTITIPKFKYISGDMNIQGRQRINRTIQIEAIKDGTNNPISIS